MLNDMDEVRDSVDDVATIEETIENGNEITLSYINTSILRKLQMDGTDDSIDVPDTNVCYDYLKELLAVADKIELSDDEYAKYKYRPDILSYDLYGTTTYEFILLAINKIISPKYFTKKKIYVIDSEYIEEVLTDIYNAEQEYITLNRADYDTTVGIETED